MPVAPFIGLGICIHILLITIFKIFRIAPNNRFLRKGHVTISAWVGSLIIVSVFGFVLSSAAALVQNSVAEAHSSVIFVQNNASLLKQIIISESRLIRIAEAE